MAPSKDQVVHDLAVACVSAALFARAMRDVKDGYGDSLSGIDFVDDAMDSYKEAFDAISASLEITD